METPDRVQTFHKAQKRNLDIIEIHDLGAGSRVESIKNRNVSSIVKNSSVTMKLGALLHRLCKWYEPELIVEFGTGLGISTAYLASGAGEVPLISIEGSREKHHFARNNSDLYANSSIEYILGDFNSEFERVLGRSKNHMLVFIDGDHRYNSTVEKVDAFIKNESVDELMIILDDIYWSDGMQEAWEECISKTEIAISIDLFYFGILIMRPGIEKQHFKINF